MLTLVNALPAGLSDAEAAARLEKHGPNELPRARRDGPLTLLWRQINTPLIWVLIPSGSVAMAADPTDGVKNGLVILAVVVLNTLIGFVQEWRAGRAIDSLSQMVPESVCALRDGRRESVPATALVVQDSCRPGDVSLFKMPNLITD